MQQLTAPPVMSSPTPSMASSVPYSPPPAPRVGPAIPGTTGGLPALSGLSVYQNPMAQQLQSMGRGDDKMLVHMTPREVQSLRGLAQLTGGDLTTNPNTGLPEAGWLGNLLPTLLGGLASVLFPAVSPLVWGAVGTAAGTAATGNLGKGLMMGLGAFGGAGLGSAIKGAVGSTTANVGADVAAKTAEKAALEATKTGAQAAVTAAPPVASTAGSSLGANLASQVGAETLAPAVASTGLPTLGAGVQQQLLEQMAKQAAEKTAGQVAGKVATEAVPKGFLADYKSATNLPFLGKAGATIGPIAGGLGVLNALSPTPKKGEPEEEKTNFPYKGPYTSTREQYALAPIDLRGPNPSAQRSYFGPVKYFDREGTEFIPGTPTSEPVPYYAKGGELGMDEGSFIFPARETAELGNGSSRAGQEVLARMGGRPIDGKGDGVSDSIPARIGGKQEARVARDEVYFSPQAVARIGGGDHNRGTKKLYALMDKAKQARKRAAVGADTGLRRGIV